MGPGTSIGIVITLRGLGSVIPVAVAIGRSATAITITVNTTRRTLRRRRHYFLWRREYHPILLS